VLWLVIDMAVGVSELSEVEALVAELQGSSAVHGKAGILQLDRTRLRLDTSGAAESFEGVPAVLEAVAKRLREVEREHAGTEQAEIARRALYQLYQLTREAT
jgi:hypothetical protein